MALVRDPRTGQMVEVPDEQVQGAGARGLAQPPINVGRAIGDVALGALSVPGAALADLATFRATQAVGGQQPAETNPRLAAALQRIGTGAEQFGQANVEAFRGLQAAGQRALGVQPAAAPTPVQPTPVPTAPVTPAPVAAAPAVARPVAARGQPGALGQAAERRQAQATEAAGVGTGIGLGRQGGEIFRRTGPGGVPEFFNEPAEGGVPIGVGGAAPSAPTGWRSNTGQSAAEFLATMRAQDREDADRRRQSGEEARIWLERSALLADAGRGTGNSRLVARQALRDFEARQLQSTQEAGATERTGLEVASRDAQTRAQTEANVLAARAQAQGQLGAAELRGQFGLQAAQTAAEGRIGAASVTATSPQAQEAAERTNILRARQQLAEQAARAGDPNAQLAALGATPPKDLRVATDLGGRPIGVYLPDGQFVRYTPEEQLEADEAFALASQR